MDIYNFPGPGHLRHGQFERQYGNGSTRYQRRQMHRIGGGIGGSSSGRAEFAAACLALEDSLTHDQPIAVLTDSKGFIIVSSDGLWEGEYPLLCHSPGGDILARIIKVLHNSVNLGLFTIFIKITAHRGEFLNEKANRWADERRDDVDNVQWDGPSSHPTFPWTDVGVEHRWRTDAP